MRDVCEYCKRTVYPDDEAVESSHLECHERANTMKPELINGRWYQPVETTEMKNFCRECVFDDNGMCYIRCTPVERPDRLNVYYIDIEGE